MVLEKSNCSAKPVSLQWKSSSELCLCGDGDVDDGLASAALGVEKVQEDLELRGAGAIAEKSAFAFLLDEVFVAKCVEVVREGGRRDSELALQLADDEPSGVRCEQETDDGDPVFVPEGREHACYLC